MVEECFEKNMAVAEVYKPDLHKLLERYMKGVSVETEPQEKDTSGDASERKQRISKNKTPKKIIIEVGIDVCGKILSFSQDKVANHWFIIYEPDIERLLEVMRAEDIEVFLKAPGIEVFAGGEGIESFKHDIYASICEYVADNHDMFIESIIEDKVVPLVDESVPEKLKPGYEKICTDCFNDMTEMAGNRLMEYFLDREVAEIAAHLKMDDEKIKRVIAKSEKLLADDWRTAKPGSVEEIYKWYKDTPFYIFNLAGYHVFSRGYRRTVELVKKALEGIKGPVLDFGGGDGDMTIRLVKCGHKVTYCDVPGKTMNYARWRFAGRGMDVGIIVSDSANMIHLDNNYEVILALDVLEHLVNPIDYCRVFYEHLEPGGLLVAKPSFSDAPDIAPMHLAENVKYNATFDDEMKRIGFVKVPPEGEVVEFWRKMLIPGGKNEH